MVEHKLTFNVGDQVIHAIYGLGVVMKLDEKEISGQTSIYYVVQIRDLTLWVPANESGEHCLRFLTPTDDFENIFHILASPGEPLSVDRYERRTQLMQRLKEGTLESISRIIRDLILYKRSKKMNDNDTTTLNRARTLLLNEWSVALSVPIQDAEQALKDLLGTDQILVS